MMNYYYRSIPSEEMSDFESFYRWIADRLPANAWIAELGVSEGRGVILLASLMHCQEKACHIWAVDNFSYGQDLQRERLLTNIKNSGEQSTIEVLDTNSLEAVGRCQDEQFNFVFVDSSHLYEITKAEIRLWIHKVKADGILAGHDYNDNPGVKQAVDELMPAEHLQQWETSNGHGVWYVEANAIKHLFR